MAPLPATVAVCKAVQNVLCFIAYNAVYCGKQCGDHDQLNQVWTNYNSLVDDFFSKRGKWTYLNNYDIKDAMISAGIQESDFTIDRDHLFLQTAKKMLAADNVKQRGIDMRRFFKIWLDNFFNWIDFKKHFDLKGSSIITTAEDEDEDRGGGRAIFIVEHSGWGNNYQQIPDDLVDQFVNYNVSSTIEIDDSDDDDDDNNNNTDDNDHDNHDSYHSTDNADNADHTDNGKKRKKNVRSKVKRRNVPTKFEHVLAFLFMFYFPIKEAEEPDAFVADLVTSHWKVKYNEVSLEDATDKSAKSRTAIRKEITSNSLKVINATSQAAHESNHTIDVNVLKLSMERKGLNDDLTNHLNNQDIFIALYDGRERFMNEMKKKQTRLSEINDMLQKLNNESVSSCETSKERQSEVLAQFMSTPSASDSSVKATAKKKPKITTSTNPILKKPTFMPSSTSSSSSSSLSSSNTPVAVPSSSSSNTAQGGMNFIPPCTAAAGGTTVNINGIPLNIKFR